MKKALHGSVATLLLLAAAGAVGCGLFSSPTTTSSTTSTIITTTTTTEPPAIWKQVKAEGVTPSARCYQALVYNSTTGEVIMFAGVGATDALEETWTYDALANAWVKAEAAGEDQPSSARQMPGAYDPTTLKVISYDGTSWGYDVSGKVWESLKPEGDKLTPARVGACMVKDDKTGKIILFGGTDMNKSYNETWGYDPGANTWTNLQPQGELPPGRSDAGMAYDPSSGKVILFGGVDSDFNCLADTWSYDPTANAWTKIATTEAPAARSGVGFAYDRHSKRFIMFGGIDSQLVCYNDTWAFDASAGSWKDLAPGGTLPMPRGRVALVYVPSIDKLVVFGGATVQADASGGFGSLVYLDDMWAFGVYLPGDEESVGTSSTTPVTSTTLPGSGSGSTSTTQ